MILLRYIALAILAPLAALVLVVAFISSLMQFARLGEVALSSLGDLWIFARLSAYVAPTLGGITLPIALLIACLIAYDKLFDNGELLAFASAGVSSRRLFAPVAAIALPIALFSMWLGLVAVPWGVGRFLDDMAELATRSFAQSVAPGAFSEALGNTALYADDVDNAHGEWRGVFVAQQPEQMQGQLLLLSPSLQIHPKPDQRAALLQVPAGEALLVHGPDQPIERLRFDGGEARLDLNRWSRREAGIYYPYQAHGLFELIDDLGDELQPRAQRKIAFFMWQKISLPFACLPLALIGALLAVGTTPLTRPRAYIWGLLVAVLFFVGHEGARGLAVDGSLSPVLASWVMVLASFALALILWWRRAGLRR